GICTRINYGRGVNRCSCCSESCCGSRWWASWAWWFTAASNRNNARYRYQQNSKDCQTKQSAHRHIQQKNYLTFEYFITPKAVGVMGFRGQINSFSLFL